MPKNTKTTENVTASPTSVAAPVMSESDKIWEQIKNLPIQMFGLPDQTIAMHCDPFPADPNRLYLTIRSTATLPSLEAALSKLFNVEMADRFVIVSRIPQPLFDTKKPAVSTKKKK